MCIEGRIRGAFRMVYGVLHLRYGTHTQNRSCHFILHRFKGDGAGGDEKDLVHNLVLSAP